MSTTTAAEPDLSEVPPPSHYAARADRGDELWIEDWITTYLDLTLGPKQREICRSVATNERTAVIGANGTGKTYITGAIVLAWQNVRYPAISFGTSGTGKKLYRTLCRPIDKLHSSALDGVGLPGTFKQRPPRIDYDDPEHYFEAATPQDAGELEGAHEEYTLAIIEEADKDDVTAETVDAMRSLIPDYEKGRFLVVGNPPTDEANVFADITADESPWHVIHISSFDAWNVLVETGERDGERIEGMATVSKLRGDWADYHDEPWPGIEQARAWSDPDHPEFRDDLDERWYRRRAGIISPTNSQVHRAFSPQLVQSGYEPNKKPQRNRPTALGVDVARSGDDTVAVGHHGDHLVVHYAATGTNHTKQEQTLAAHIRDWPSPEIAIDAVGEGSGLADGLDNRFGAHRYKSNETAHREDTYDRCWGESLALFGEFLREGGTFSNSDLYEQAQVAARTVTWDERFLDSRGDDGAAVLRATPKEEVQNRLGRSPDHLDAALMAVWRECTEPEQEALPSPTW